jgi:hypothetical protein
MQEEMEKSKGGPKEKSKIAGNNNNIYNNSNFQLVVPSIFLLPSLLFSLPRFLLFLFIPSRG